MAILNQEHFQFSMIAKWDPGTAFHPSLVASIIYGQEWQTAASSSLHRSVFGMVEWYGKVKGVLYMGTKKCESAAHDEMHTKVPSSAVHRADTTRI